MALIRPNNLFHTLDTFSPPLAYGIVDSVGAKYISYSDGELTTEYKGSFTLQGEEVTDGKITRIISSIGSTDVFVAWDFSRDAVTFFSYLEVGDTSGAMSYLLAGKDDIRGTKSHDLLRGYAGSDSIFGDAGDDLLVGDQGNDHLYGENGHDTLRGGSGHDVLSGYNGFDTLIGGTGNDYLSTRDAFNPGYDRLIGGAGADIFDLTIYGNDRIADFNPLEDMIYLQDSSGLLSSGLLPSESFVSGPGAIAQDSNDCVIYDTDTGRIYYDLDGAGGDVPYLIATLKGHPTLTADDFLLIN